MQTYFVSEVSYEGKDSSFVQHYCFFFFLRIASVKTYHLHYFPTLHETYPKIKPKIVSTKYKFSKGFPISSDLLLGKQNNTDSIFQLYENILKPSKTNPQNLRNLFAREYSAIHQIGESRGGEGCYRALPCNSILHTIYILGYDRWGNMQDVFKSTNNFRAVMFIYGGIPEKKKILRIYIYIWVNEYFTAETYFGGLTLSRRVNYGMICKLSTAKFDLCIY